MAGVSYSFSPGRARPINGLLTFSKSSLQQLAQPHDHAIVLTLEVRRHLMKRILVDSGSVADRLYLPTLIQLNHKLDNLCNSGRVLIEFNGM